jgi:hypothetical protein
MLPQVISTPYDIKPRKNAVLDIVHEHPVELVPDAPQNKSYL